jgi:hypothetical protein
MGAHMPCAKPFIIEPLSRPPQADFTKSTKAICHRCGALSAWWSHPEGGLGGETGRIGQINRYRLPDGQAFTLL